MTAAAESTATMIGEAIVCPLGPAVLSWYASKSLSPCTRLRLRPRWRRRWWKKKRRAHTLTHTRIIYSCVYTCGRACVTDDGMSNYYSWEKALYTSSSTTIIIDYNIIMVLIILLLCAGARRLVPFTWKNRRRWNPSVAWIELQNFFFSLLKILYSLVMFITTIILLQILIISNVVTSNISKSRTFFWSPLILI